ncbi:Protein of unknown function [Pyronema omphalodes CBS 100304]|uniref:Uncharacterized protein n=1 Tax=Pyronema omphalodes (strain CBS 100304) TaxID=1076935 RepID=U4KWR0_PYROM|nr:Protein of unknown function [Pyronema omphalodes CBS 100304]
MNADTEPRIDLTGHLPTKCRRKTSGTLQGSLFLTLPSLTRVGAVIMSNL